MARRRKKRGGRVASKKAAKVVEFRSLTTLAPWAEFCLWGFVLLDLVGTWPVVQRYLLGARAGDGWIASADVVAIDANIELQQYAGYALSAIAGVTFLVWQYRAQKNLEPLYEHRPRFTPGDALIAWFLPIINFYRPFHVIRELWHASDPDGFDAEGEQESARGKKSPRWIKIWWALWILGTFVALIALAMADTLLGSQARIGALLMLLALAIDITTNVLTILIVRRVTAMQTRRHERIEGR